jgi:hypothetical protein
MRSLEEFREISHMPHPLDFHIMEQIGIKEMTRQAFSPNKNFL